MTASSSSTEPSADLPDPIILPDGVTDLAVRLADAAGSVIRRYYRTPFAVDDKPDSSPVTIADREAEAADLLRQHIDHIRQGLLDLARRRHEEDGPGALC